MPKNYAEMNPDKIMMDNKNEKTAPDVLEEKQENISRNEKLVVDVLDKALKIDGKKLKDIPGSLKWSLDFTKANKGEGEISHEAVKSLMSGVIRGSITERVSCLVPLEAAETFLPPGEETASVLAGVRIVNTSELPSLRVERSWKKGYWENPKLREGQLAGKKAGILQSAAASTVAVPKGVLRKYKEQYKAEVIEGYGGSPPSPSKKTENREGAEGGLYYDKTTMPDGFIVSQEGTLVGVVEVKAYSPKEFQLYVEEARKQGRLSLDIDQKTYNEYLETESTQYGGKIRLGLDIDGEQKMLDILRGADSLDPLEVDGLVVLRVPNDVNRDDIEGFQLHCQKLGYHNVVVQRLPLSFDELNQLGKQAVITLQEEFKKKDNRALKKNELRILEEYADIKLVD